MALTSIAVDPATKDILFTNGAMSLVEGRDAIVQGLDEAMQLAQGEWYADPNDGLPWLDRIVIKNANEADVLQIVAAYILRQPGIFSVDALDWSVDRDTRVATITGQARDDTNVPVPVNITV